MKKNLALLVTLFLLVIPAKSETANVSLYFGDFTLPFFGWMPGTWNLNDGPLTISYTLDLSEAPNVAYTGNYGHNGAVGLVHVDLTSSWYGAWMSGFLSDWDNPGAEFPDYPDIDGNQDLDDKFNMARMPYPGSWSETMYDVYCATHTIAVSPFGSGANYGIWFDRDGVDPWQDDDPNTPGPNPSGVPWGVVNGGTYNTDGVYDIQLTYNKVSDTQGVTCAVFFPALLNHLDYIDQTDDIQGIPTGFNRLPGGIYQDFPAGISFETDVTKMADMEVFVSGNPGNGTIMVKDLVVTGYMNLEEGMATGGGWFIPEDDKAHGISFGGKATFGFVAKQKKGASSGQLEFQYHVDDLNLKSTSYDWVTLATTQVMFEGIGTLNGEYGYKFRVRAVDGDKIGTSTDRFEIRIWTNSGDFDMPTYRAEGDLSGGQIVVHKK